MTAEPRKHLGTITRATLRLDGFASATAGHTGAEIVTKPLIFSGDRLEISVTCSARGHLNAELQSADGQPLPGFSLTDATTSTTTTSAIP